MVNPIPFQIDSLSTYGGADWLGVVAEGETEDQVVEVRLDIALR